MDQKVINILEQDGYQIEDEASTQDIMRITQEEMQSKNDQAWFEEAAVAIR